MPYPYTIPEIIEIGKLSAHLSQIDVLKSSLFGRKLDPRLPLMLNMESDSVEWEYLVPQMGAIAATGSIEITNLGLVGDTINVKVSGVSVGIYTRLSTDTDIPTLAASIAANLSYLGFTFIASGNFINVTALSALGSSVNGALTVEITNYSRIFDYTFDNTFN